jgi:hypothetical protein
MANMSYCRWQNTLVDLRECAADLDDKVANLGLHATRCPDEDGHAPLSADEAKAREQLFFVVAEMLDQLGVEVDLDHVVARLRSLR